MLAQVVVDQLTKRSGGNRTILMHAARSGDAMTLSAVKDACQKVCDPSTVSEPSQGIVTLRGESTRALSRTPCTRLSPNETSSVHADIAFNNSYVREFIIHGDVF